MTRIRRGGYVFVSWVGDHGPRHVHVLKNGRVVGKWDVEGGRAMVGLIPRDAIAAIDSLRREGRL